MQNRDGVSLAVFAVELCLNCFGLCNAKNDFLKIFFYLVDVIVSESLSF